MAINVVLLKKVVAGVGSTVGHCVVDNKSFLFFFVFILCSLALRIFKDFKVKLKFLRIVGH